MASLNSYVNPGRRRLPGIPTDSELAVYATPAGTTARYPGMDAEEAQSQTAAERQALRNGLNARMQAYQQNQYTGNNYNTQGTTSTDNSRLGTMYAQAMSGGMRPSAVVGRVDTNGGSPLYGQEAFTDLGPKNEYGLRSMKNFVPDRAGQPGVQGILGTVGSSTLGMIGGKHVLTGPSATREMYTKITKGMPQKQALRMAMRDSIERNKQSDVYQSQLARGKEQWQQMQQMRNDLRAAKNAERFGLKLDQGVSDRMTGKEAAAPAAPAAPYLTQAEKNAMTSPEGRAKIKSTTGVDPKTSTLQEVYTAMRQLDPNKEDPQVMDLNRKVAAHALSRFAKDDRYANDPHYQELQKWSNDPGYQMGNVETPERSLVGDMQNNPFTTAAILNPYGPVLAPYGMMLDRMELGRNIPKLWKYITGSGGKKSGTVQKPTVKVAPQSGDYSPYDIQFPMN